METITKVQAIKEFFERDDNLSPGGGRKVSMQELKELGGAGLNELAPLCAATLGKKLA